MGVAVWAFVGKIEFDLSAMPPPLKKKSKITKKVEKESYNLFKTGRMKGWWQVDVSFLFTLIDQSFDMEFVVASDVLLLFMQLVLSNQGRLCMIPLRHWLLSAGACDISQQENEHLKASSM